MSQPSYRRHCAPLSPIQFSDRLREVRKMPHVRKLRVGPADNPNNIGIRWIPRAANDLRSIEGSLPELQRELATRWPVKRVRRSRLMRNPADPTHWELDFIVELTKPLITAVVEGSQTDSDMPSM